MCVSVLDCCQGRMSRQLLEVCGCPSCCNIPLTMNRIILQYWIYLLTTSCKWEYLLLGRCDMLSCHGDELPWWCDPCLDCRELPASSLSLSSTMLDFGNVVGEHQTVTNAVAITNVGTATGRYSVSARHLPDYITVAPQAGEIPAGQQQCVVVSYLWCWTKHCNLILFIFGCCRLAFCVVANVL